MATISELPNELLLVIFKLVHRLHWKLAWDGWLSSDEGSWLDDPFAPWMFPFAQAKVCQRWCALLASCPRFWTRVPIVVHPATAPPHHVQDHLAWSQDLPIQVFVRSHPDGRDVDEKPYVDAILPHISKHLCRIKTLEFTLLHTPIPNLQRWLIGPASLLESIKLSRARGYPAVTPSVIHDYDSDPRDDRDEQEFRFSAPKLASLSIDWRTFVQACCTNGTWLANAPELRRLALTPSEPFFPAVEDLSIGDTIKAISQSGSGLSSISIHRIPFADNPEAPELPATFEVYTSMTFEGLKGTEVATFVAGGGLDTALESLSVKNCSKVLDLGGFWAYYLCLEDLSEDCDFTKLFRDIETYDVSLRNCAAFNDTFLEFMTNGGSTGHDIPTRGIGTLVLNQCTNFSVECLFRMVLSRRTAREADPEWDGTEEGLTTHSSVEQNAIVDLYVNGGPFLSEEYRAEFKRLVPRFGWD